ncbi:MAG: hypothetical protein H6815_03645 [Phycisphaeraceae bacterium]|nr:hypothetical protein [Phycisphaerales bacterium]MCB9859522.1 hypothetical protein [Phycisphaeraceae bacterium]
MRWNNRPSEWGAPPKDPGERARWETERFINWALANNVQLPRIPTCPVSEGGFASLHTDEGQQRAAMWWESTLDAVERDPDDLSEVEFDDPDLPNDRFKGPL